MAEAIHTLGDLAEMVAQKMQGLEGHIDESVRSHVRSALSGSELENLLRENFPNVIESLAREDSDTGRKIRGWASSARDPKLSGSKYGRLGLTVGDVEMVYEITTAAHKRGMSNGPSEELRNVYNAVSQGRYEDAGLVRSRAEQQLVEMFKEGQLTRGQFAAYSRAMDTAESGFGQQLIGAQYVHELWRGAQATAKVFNLIRRFEMTDATAFLPVQATLPVVRYVQESTVANSAAYATTKTGTNRVEVTPRTLVMSQKWSYDLEEDSIVSLVALIREEAERSWAHHLDSIILNGDTTVASSGNINSDDQTPESGTYYTAWDGVRHVGLVDNTSNSANVAGPVTIHTFRGSKGRMLDTTYKHDWGHPVDPDELVYIADPETADAVSMLDECLTVDKIGERATVLSGQQGRILNHPLIASIDVSKTAADGKVDAATPANNDYGQIVALNRRGFVIGTRAQMQVEADRDIETSQHLLVWRTRMAFGRYSPTGAAAGIESADVMYNIAL